MKNSDDVGFAFLKAFFTQYNEHLRKDIYHKDKALNRKAKVIRNLRDKIEELEFAHLMLSQELDCLRGE